jgi:DNA-binding NarL/FixJ family response regulator
MSFTEQTLGQILSCQTQNDPDKWRKPALSTLEDLDPLDKNILRHVSLGLPYKQIAQKVYLSVPGIKYRIRDLKEKTGCRNLSELVTYFKDTLDTLAA